MILNKWKSYTYQMILIRQCMSHCLRINHYVQKIGGIGLDGIHLKWIIGTDGNWKNQNPGGSFGAIS